MQKKKNTNLLPQVLSSLLRASPQPSLCLFPMQIRWTQRVSVFPVGLVGRFGVSSPVVHRGRVVGFHDSYMSGRKFAVDMAGFAVNLDLVLRARSLMPYRLGMQETRFLENLNVTVQDLEPLASNCTEVRTTTKAD